MNSILTVETAWDNLEQAVKALEQRQGDWEVMAATCQAAIQLLLEFEPEEILAQLKGSQLPSRATVSWLVFEAAKMKDLDQERVAALADLWRRQSGQDLIAPPSGAKDEPFYV
jgi:hypothetical protein